MKTPQELETMFDVTNEQLAKWEKDASCGILPGKPSGAIIHGAGRPPIFEEQMRQVGFKEPVKTIEAIDRRAAELGMKRSEYLRYLVDKDIHQSRTTESLT